MQKQIFTYIFFLFLLCLGKAASAHQTSFADNTTKGRSFFYTYNSVKQERDRNKKDICFRVHQRVSSASVQQLFDLNGSSFIVAENFTSTERQLIRSQKQENNLLFHLFPFHFFW